MKIEFYGLPVVKLTNDALFVWINKMTKKECFDWIAENKPTFIYYNSERPIEFAAYVFLKWNILWDCIFIHITFDEKIY